MFIYWLMYVIVTIMAVSTSQKQSYRIMPWVVIGFLFMILIGFRYEVGGDWGNYLNNYQRILGLSFVDAVKGGDPGHKFLFWISSKWGLSIYGTNIVYAVIFVWGLIKFSRQQLYPWLTMVAATPYLITVVAMGYSRQGVAIGLFLLAMSHLDRGKFKTYVVLILIAALFHKTAILLLPLGIFLYGKGVMLRLLMIIPIAYGAWDLLLADQQEDLWRNYVEVQMESSGAQIRVAMNLIPALLLLIYKKEWQKNFNDYRFWFWISIGSIISVFLVGFASTAVDRISLYFIPIQLVVFSRLPYLARKQIPPTIMKLIIIFVYALVLFVWLTFATHSIYWLPYQNVLFTGLI